MKATSERVGPFTPAQATVLLIAVTFVLRAIGAWAIGWGTGEAYYLSSARQFHLSYFDQPPLSLWVIWATMQLTGSENVLVVRLPFIAMFAVSTWLVFDIVRRIHSPLGGFYAALIVNASILFSISIGSWTQPDAPMVLFWLATIRVLLEVFFGEGTTRPYALWALAGLMLGLTFLSKYHAVFIVAGTGLFILFNSTQRHWLTHKAPWLALVLTLAVFSPVILWNAQNDWVSFGFQGGRALAESSLRWEGFIRMIWGQLLYMTPWLALPALYIGIRALAAGPRGQFPTGATPGAAALFAYIGWPPVIFFTLVALWSDTQFHFHWQAPGYLMLFMLMGAWAGGKNSRGIRVWLWGSAALTLAILTFLTTHAATGWVRNLVPGDWEDPTALQLPWTELGEALEAEGAFTAPKIFIAGTDWIDCGYIDTQVAGRTPFACIGPDPRNLQFNFNDADYAGWDAYLVVQTGSLSYAQPYFDEIKLLDTLTVSRNGIVELTGIDLYRATGFQPE